MVSSSVSSGLLSDQMAETAGRDDQYSLFEVHRVGSLPRHQAASLSLPEVSRTYTELVPISSMEQLSKASALAIVPPSDHMIVDKNKFKDMVTKSAKDIAAKTSEASVRRMEESIKVAQEDMVAEVVGTLNMISQVIVTDQETLKSNLQKTWEVTSDASAEGLEKRRAALEQAMASQQATLQRVFDLIVAKRSEVQHFEFTSPTGEPGIEGSQAESS